METELDRVPTSFSAFHFVRCEFFSERNSTAGDDSRAVAATTQLRGRPSSVGQGSTNKAVQDKRHPHTHTVAARNNDQECSRFYLTIIRLVAAVRAGEERVKTKKKRHKKKKRKKKKKKKKKKKRTKTKEECRNEPEERRSK